MRDVNAINLRLEQLGLSKDEAAIFLQMLEAPQSQLEISRATGIARSNVYRIVDGMAAKGLVCEQTTEDGKLLATAQPDALELLVLEQEVSTQASRDNLRELLPALEQLQGLGAGFALKTYSGLGGVKQMLWNELKSTSEIRVFSGDTLDVATGKRWAEKYRAEIMRRGLQLRGIENLAAKQRVLTAHEQYAQHYHARYLPHEVLNLKFELSIHDDTISIYNELSGKVYVGTEITNSFLAAFMRQVFEQYWALASS